MMVAAHRSPCRSSTPTTPPARLAPGSQRYGTIQVDRCAAILEERNRWRALEDDTPAPDQEEGATSAWSLERLLATLKPAQSRVIRLVKLQGLSIEEASRATGQSAPLVKVNIHRGIKRLTSLLRGEFEAH